MTLITRTTCVACGAPALPKPFFDSPSWRVLRCSECTYAWVVDVSEEAGDTAFDWGEDIFEESKRRRPMYQDRLERVARLSPSPKTWLDIGCGGGGMLSCVKDGGFEAEGIEPSPAADLISSKLGIPVHKRGLSESLNDLAHQKYGVISYFHVLEHVLDPAAELQVARTRLADTGIFVVEVPFFDSPVWKVMGRRHRHFYRAHRSYFNKKSLTTLLKNSGFDVLQCQAVPYYMTLDWLLMRAGGPAKLLRPLASKDGEARPIKINTGEYLMSISRKA